MNEYHDGRYPDYDIRERYPDDVIHPDDLPCCLSKALWAGQTEGEGLKISDLVFSFLNVPTGCGHDL